MEFDRNASSNAIWKPYIHVTPFLFGIILGYLVKTKKFTRLNKVRNYIYWSISLFVLTIVTYDTYPWSFGHEYGPWESILTFVVSRTIWSAAITWIIWACVTSNGGLVNQFLSWDLWIPLSRLSYSVYLTHAWSIWLFVGSARSGLDTSVYSFVSQIFIMSSWHKNDKMTKFKCIFRCQYSLVI